MYKNHTPGKLSMFVPEMTLPGKGPRLWLARARDSVFRELHSKEQLAKISLRITTNVYYTTKGEVVADPPPLHIEEKFENFEKILQKIGTYLTNEKNSSLPWTRHQGNQPQMLRNCEFCIATV